MQITDLKGRKIELEFHKHSTTAYKQQVGVYFDGDKHMLFFHARSNAKVIAEAFNVPESAVDTSGRINIIISKETYLAIATEAAKHNDGKGIYSHSEDCPFREIPNWATDCDGGHWNIYIGKDGKENKRFHGYY